MGWKQYVQITWESYYLSIETLHHEHPALKEHWEREGHKVG